MEVLELEYKTVINHIKNRDIDETSMRFAICDLYADSIVLMDSNPVLKCDDIVRLFQISGASYAMANDLSDFMYKDIRGDIFEFFNKYIE